MKREGRQHGMVRSHRILPSPRNSRPKPRFVQQLDSFPTAGLFTKVSKKPTNHSKFTGRCGKTRCLGCHLHPACKARNKSKGNHKLRSSDMTTNYGLIAWRVVGGSRGLKFSGFSATSILDHLSNDNNDYDNDDDDKKDESVDDDVRFVLNQDLGEEGWCLVGEN